MSRWIASFALGCAVLAPLGVHVGLAGGEPAPAVDAQPSHTDGPGGQAVADLEAWKAELEKIAGGVWITSNAAYREADGPDEYGMSFTVQPGGAAAIGCLWGEREGELVAVFWNMFQAWDPVRKAGFFYQTHPAGIVGLGYTEDAGPDVPPLIQDFRQPDGTMTRGGHFERWDGPDTRVTRSVDWSGADWTPRREYTWVRVRDRDSRC